MNVAGPLSQPKNRASYIVVTVKCLTLYFTAMTIATKKCQCSHIDPPIREGGGTICGTNAYVNFA